MSASIVAVDKGTVAKICSGQVIVELAVAIKELVENGIDAGATKVDVKINDYGVTSFEVTDNGSGIVPENYEGLTAKYHTSKITNFQDLAV